MLDKIYSNKSEKDLKQTLKIYTALLIVSVSLLIVLNVLSYFFLSGNFHLEPSILIVVIIFWSALNIDFLKKIILK